MLEWFINLNWELFVKFVGTILSWPVVVAIISIYALKNYKISIDGFISRIIEWTFPGGCLKASTAEAQNKVALPVPEKDMSVSNQNLDENATNKLKTIQDNYNNLYKVYVNERAMNIIFGTQIAILEYLEKMGLNGIRYIDLFPYYQEYQRRSGDFYTTPENYFAFLKNWNLIVIDFNSSIVKITDVGLGFLNYIRSAYPAYQRKAN